MSDDSTLENQTNESDEAAIPKGTEPDSANDDADKAPWEKNGEEFSPEKAWNLIRNLRADNAKLKESDDAKAVKLREIEDANLSEKEKADRDLKEAREQLDAIRTQKAWAEAMAEHQCLTKEDFDLIGAGSPQEVREKAAKLAARLDAQAVSKTDSNHINPLLRADPTGGTDSDFEEDGRLDALGAGQIAASTHQRRHDMADNFSSQILRGDLGGALIPDEISQEIIQTLPQSSVLLTRARRVPMSSKKKTQPVLASLPRSVLGVRRRTQADVKDRMGGRADHGRGARGDRPDPRFGRGRREDQPVGYGQAAHRRGHGQEDRPGGHLRRGQAVHMGQRHPRRRHRRRHERRVRHRSRPRRRHRHDRPEAQREGLRGQRLRLPARPELAACPPARRERPADLHAVRRRPATPPACTATRSTRSPTARGTPPRPCCSRPTGRSSWSACVRTSPTRSSTRASSPTPRATWCTTSCSRTRRPCAWSCASASPSPTRVTRIAAKGSQYPPAPHPRRLQEGGQVMTAKQVRFVTNDEPFDNQNVAELAAFERGRQTRDHHRRIRADRGHPPRRDRHRPGRDEGHERRRGTLGYRGRNAVRAARRRHRHRRSQEGHCSSPTSHPPRTPPPSSPRSTPCSPHSARPARWPRPRPPTSRPKSSPRRA